MLTRRNITGLILAGGAGTRVAHQDKGLMIFEDKKLIERQIEWLKPQVDEILISANRNIEEYQSYGYRVLTDRKPSVAGNETAHSAEFGGPLYGLYQGLLNCQTSHVFVHPVDLPFLPNNTVVKLIQKLNKLQLNKQQAGASNSNPNPNPQAPSSCFLKTTEREHYLSLMIEREYIDALKIFLEANNRQVSLFLKQNNITGVNIDLSESHFANFNSISDFQQN